MKRILSVFVMLTLLLLAGCGPVEAPVQTPPDGGNAQIANPWRDLSEAEAKALSPQRFSVPEGAENASWRVMEADGAPALIQLDFDLDGNRFTVRQQQTGDPDADLSGLYLDWTAQENAALRGSIPCTLYRCLGEAETVDLCTWYDEASGVSWSLSVTAKDLDGFDLLAAAEALFPPTVPSEEEQKRILEENRSLWAFDEGEYAPDWYYAFTDLDHNGLLEVLAASTQGSGVFTYVRFFEVLPDGSGVRNLYHADLEVEGPDDWPEIIRDSLPCYYDPAADRYYYPCENLTRAGAAYQHAAWYALCLKDGAAEWELLASKVLEWENGAELPADCRDALDNPISEHDYDRAVERRFAGMEPSVLTLDWIAVTPGA